VKNAIVVPAALLLATAVTGWEIPQSWVTPVEPFRLIGNIHYVGTEELSAFLITTPEGHILLDAPLEENVPAIIASIDALGFRLDEIRILINSHAHFDHAGGLAAMKQRTGATLFLSPPDADLARRGGKNDFAFEDRVPYPAVAADHLLEDEVPISLGGISLTPLFTPGHTRGATSWLIDVEDDGEALRVVIISSVSAPGYKLHDNSRYPEIVDDYRFSFDRLSGLEADVFLAPHAHFFRMKEARARLGESPNPFIDGEALARHLDYWRSQFERELEKQRGAVNSEQ
jgi:metallo-beta-lactamase class B